jgi:hypothetical protein
MTDIPPPSTHALITPWTATLRIQRSKTWHRTCTPLGQTFSLGEAVSKSQNFRVVFAVALLVLFAGCKSMRPKPGKPGVEKTEIKPPKPAQFDLVNRDAPPREASQSKLEREADRIASDRLQNNGLVFPSTLGTGVLNDGLVDQGFVLRPGTSGLVTGAGGFDSFSQPNIDGSEPAPLPQSALGQGIQQIGLGLGTALVPNQVSQSPCGPGGCPGSRGSGPLAPAATHGAGGALSVR